MAAYDISPTANATYELNHGDSPLVRELASLPAAALAAQHVDLWALSPPCQPFCRMGNQQGLEDPRSRAFMNLLELLPQATPRHLLLENVVGFRDSDAHGRLIGVLRSLGFRWLEYELCPTRFGIPNQRPRLFLVASQDELAAAEPPEVSASSISPYLDPDEDPTLYLSSELLARHKPGLDLVTAGDRRTACFIGGYGQRFVGSGSFLKTEQGIRRFSTAEVARFMGLPATFRFPGHLGREQRYKLLGNGLNLSVARWVAERLRPGLSAA